MTCHLTQLPPPAKWPNAGDFRPAARRTREIMPSACRRRAVTPLWSASAAAVAVHRIRRGTLAILKSRFEMSLTLLGFLKNRFETSLAQLLNNSRQHLQSFRRFRVHWLVDLGKSYPVDHGTDKSTSSLWREEP